MIKGLKDCLKHKKLKIIYLRDDKIVAIKICDFLNSLIKNAFFLNDKVLVQNGRLQNVHGISGLGRRIRFFSQLLIPMCQLV